MLLLCRGWLFSCGAPGCLFFVLNVTISVFTIRSHNPNMGKCPTNPSAYLSVIEFESFVLLQA
jgi:hypothetical protein